MRVVIQRVKSASVIVDKQIVGKINQGFLMFVGIAKGDIKEDIDYIVNKTAKLRVFEDKEGKMNRSILDIDGQVLLVSQFTLLGDVRKGNRPSFYEAMPPQEAKQAYMQTIKCFNQTFGKIQTGEFAADMAVELINDGPVTILLDSKRKF